MCHLWHNSRYYCVYIWNKVPWGTPAGEGLDLSTDNLFGGTDTDKGVFPTIHHDTIHNFVNFKHPSVVCLGPLEQPYTESLSKSLKFTNQTILQEQGLNFILDQNIFWNMFFF